jgi:hypothetical protein
MLVKNSRSPGAECFCTVVDDVEVVVIVVVVRLVLTMVLAGSLKTDISGCRIFMSSFEPYVVVMLVFAVTVVVIVDTANIKPTHVTAVG